MKDRKFCLPAITCSLGLLLYELLCGQHAHGVEDKSAEAVKEIVARPCPPCQV